MSRKSVARRKGQESSKKKKKKKKKTVRRMEFADIPECQVPAYAHDEYKTSREEKIWDPKVDVEGWIHHYSFAARIALTCEQQPEDIPNIEAIENSCSGVAEQYISDVLHESEYEPYDALRMISAKDLPQKFIDKWKPEEMKLFTEGVMKHGKRFSIIRRELLPHKRVEDFADFYYVWKRSSMAEDWRKARAIIKAEEKEMEEKRSKKRTKKRRCNQQNNEPVPNLSSNESVCNPSNNEILRNVLDRECPRNPSNARNMRRSETAAAIHSLQYGKETDNDNKSSTSTSQSEKNEETSSAVESTDSSMEHVQKRGHHFLETATSEKSPMKNQQILDNSMKCPKQRHKRKLSIPRKIVNFEEESTGETEEIRRALAPIIPQWKRQRRCKFIF